MKNTIKKTIFSILLSLTASALAAPPPAKDFFENAQYSDARISPSGRYVALRVNDERQRDSLVIFDVAAMKVTGLARLEDEDIGEHRWLNDNRLVFNVYDRRSAMGDWRFAPGLFSVDRNGGNLRRLANRDRASENSTNSMIKNRAQPWNTYLLQQDSAQDSEILYVRRVIWRENTHEILRTDLVKLDASNGLGESVNRPAPAQGWLLDTKGEPRVMLSLAEGKETVHYRDAASGEWRAVTTFNAYKGKTYFAPLGFMGEQRMLVKSYSSGDKVSLGVFDLATGQMEKEPLISMADFDFSGTPVYVEDKLVGIHYLADGHSTVWFDAAMKDAQKKVDALMPGTTNLITPPRHPQTPWVLVRSSSDRQPANYLVFNTSSGELAMLGSSHPAIKPADMGQEDLMHFKARDGMSIPAWLTLPKAGGKKLPMVVMVHGGPYVRGSAWGWDPDSQFLASRGYAVLEPEFRGSTGYGSKLFSAGRKQWGLAMQDDLADAVKWAVAQGIADPNRVCIMGGSYGGYATLMGLVKDPSLYRCGIAYAAVTDIPLLFNSGAMVLSDMSDHYKQYGAPELIGDVAADNEQFIATSPLKQAARITRPLLLAHGSDDRRVPVDHFHKMRSALEASGAKAEFVEYPGETHGWFLPSTRLDFWGRVEKFLDRNIGAGAKTE
jgi:dipeptidyl aminopeptidase/acylaminoacyl peptidase